MGMAVLGAVTALVVSLAQAGDPSSLGYTAEPGAWPVSGSRTWTEPTDEVYAFELDGVLFIDGGDSSGRNWLGVELAGANGAPLGVGSYTGGNFRLHPEAAGVNLISDGLGSGDGPAEFTITTLEHDPVTGRLSALDVEVTVHNGSPTGPRIDIRAHYEV